MSLVLGDSIIFSVWDGSAYNPVACLTSNSLSETKNIIESQTKCDPGQIVKTPNSYTYEISIEGELPKFGVTGREEWSDLRTDLVAGTLVEWSIGAFVGDDSIQPIVDTIYYGSAYLSEVSLDAAAGDEIVTFSATLVGDGKTAITTVEPNP